MQLLEDNLHHISVWPKCCGNTTSGSERAQDSRNLLSLCQWYNIRASALENWPYKQDDLTSGHIFPKECPFRMSISCLTLHLKRPLITRHYTRDSLYKQQQRALALRWALRNERRLSSLLLSSCLQASVLMQMLSYPTVTVLPNKITRTRIVLSFIDSPMWKTIRTVTLHVAETMLIGDDWDVAPANWQWQFRCGDDDEGAETPYSLTRFV